MPGKVTKALAMIWLVFAFSLQVSLAHAVVSSVEQSVRIGVLALRGKQATTDSWQPMADHISRFLTGYRFNVVPLNLDEVERAVKEKSIDFLITNTGQYISLEQNHSISRIATLRNLRQGQAYSKFGAVVFTRAGQSDINTLADLENRSFMAVKKEAFGGFQMAWYEMKQQGIDPFNHFSRLEFSGLPQDQIPMAVLTGKVDAGTVRTDVLERMAGEGKFNLDSFKILNPRRVNNFPFLLSTDLYPEWPFAVLPNTDSELAKRVQLALLVLDEKSPAARAANSAGWTVPLDYSATHKLMRALAVGPHSDPLDQGLFGILHKYWTVIVAIAIVTVPPFWFYIIRLFIRSRKLERNRMQAEADWLQGMDLLADPTLLLDLDDRIIRANKAFYDRLGVTEKDAVGERVSKFFRPDSDEVLCEDCRLRHDKKDATVILEADDPQNMQGYPMEVTIRVVRDQNDEPTRIIQSVRDLTEVRKREILLKQENKVLQQIVQGTSTTGDDYYKELVRNLAKTLKVKYAFVSEIVDPENITRVRAFAVWGGNKFIDPVEYDLAGTPCENVTARELCFYGDRVQEIFPDDQMLVDMGVNSYLGVPFFSGKGVPLGHIAVMHDQALVDQERYSAIIQIFADRVGAEVERRLAYKALEESEYRFKGLFDTAPDPSVIVDESGKIAFVNAQFIELFGYDKTEIQGQSIEMLVPEEFRMHHPKMRAAYIEDPEPRPMGTRPELMAVKKDGSRFSVEIALSPLETSEGLFVTTVIRDVTIQKQSERELERLASFPMMSPIPVLEVNMDGHITYENPVSSRLFPELRNRGFDHPLLQNIDEVLPDLKAGKRSIVRDVTVDGSIYEQQLSYISETDLLRIYSWDVTNLHEMTQQMAHQASHDSLTGLLNRREFEQQLERLIQSAVFEDSVHVLCYIDLDQFKVVNDTCGHSAGDELLRQITRQLKNSVRESDSLARLGGDEFGLLLTGCPPVRGEKLADNLRQVISDYEFVWESQSFKIGASIGLVEINRASGSLAEVLSAADSACYAAKDLGRNRIYVYHPEDKLVSRSVSEMNWTHRIRRALNNDEFLLYYQTIVSLGDQDDTHCEILLRMIDPEGKLVLPGAFIPAAERFGLMAEIDKWVVSHSLSIIADGDNSFSSYSINLSGQTIGEPGAMNFIVDCVDKSGIEPSMICFEITETSMISNQSSAEKYIRILRSMGCEFALDDFGTGLSSFSYLKNLPVDRLKIDAHFVKDIEHDKVNATMVESINVVGHSMNLVTVAEGVENESLLKVLRGIGVDYAQGYAISMPEMFTGQCISIPKVANAAE